MDRNRGLFSSCHVGMLLGHWYTCTSDVVTWKMEEGVPQSIMWVGAGHAWAHPDLPLGVDLNIAFSWEWFGQHPQYRIRRTGKTYKWGQHILVHITDGMVGIWIEKYHLNQPTECDNLYCWRERSLFGLNMTCLFITVKGSSEKSEETFDCLYSSLLCVTRSLKA